ncbi:putative nitroreductase [Coniothyrium glycines]
MSVSTARSLAMGLVAGLLLALILQQLVFSTQLPSPSSTEAVSHLPKSDSMAQVLKNIVQGSRHRTLAGGYKSASSLRPLISSVSPASSSIPHLSPTHSKAFTTSPNMPASKSFADAFKDRRTIYQLNNKAPISDKEIQDIAEQALLHVPSSFNSQSTRLVVLLNKDHEQFWDFVLEVLKPLTPEEQFSKTQQKVSGFRAAKGSILFYEDPEPVENLRKAFPLYAHHFGDWSEHTSAMHQYALWVALEAEGFGANLQHYNPVIDQKAAQHWNIPLQWKLRGQLVFGGRAGEAGEKKFQETYGKRLFVHGAN